MEGLKLSDANLLIYVHPSMGNKVSEAIPRELSSLLFKFSETFDGVLLAYKFNLLGNLAKILPGIHPYFGVRLNAELLLFNPKPGMLLEGKVVKLSPQSIHIIVLGFSSAIIIEEDIRKEFKYKIKHGKELFVNTSHKRHKIKVGTTIRFVVNSFDEEVLHISGSLLASQTGNAHWLDINLDEWSYNQSSSKKRKKSERKHVTLVHDNAMVTEKPKRHRSVDA